MRSLLTHLRHPRSPGAPRTSSPLTRLLTATSLALVVAMLALAAPASSLTPTVSAQAPLKIRMAVLPIFISAPMFIAQDKGYFTQAGVTVEMTTLWQASEIIAAFAAGELDGSAGGFGPAQMNAVSQGSIDVRLIAPLHSEKPPVATPLVVRKALWDDGTVRSVADLKGRKVAINSRGSAIEYWFIAALATGGLTPNDVDVVVMPFTDAVIAMQNGAVDGALIGEPDVTRAELAGGIVRLTEDFVDDIQVTAVYFKSAFLAENRPAVERFLAAFLQGARDLDGTGYRDPANIAILSKYTQTPAEVLSVARTPFHDPDGRVHVEDFQKLNDFFVAQGTVRQPLDMSSIIDLTYADAARRILAAGR